MKVTSVARVESHVNAKRLRIGDTVYIRQNNTELHVMINVAGVKSAYSSDVEA